MLESYPFVNDTVMAYFKRRLSHAPRDAEFALDYVRRNARTRTEQVACTAATRFRCDILWAQIYTLHHAYVDPGLMPRGRQAKKAAARSRSTTRLAGSRVGYCRSNSMHPRCIDQAILLVGELREVREI